MTCSVACRSFKKIAGRLESGTQTGKMKKMNLGGEPKETAISRENVPADGNNPAQRNEAGISARPPLRPSDQSVTYLSPTGAARARFAVIFPVLLHRFGARSGAACLKLTWESGPLSLEAISGLPPKPDVAAIRALVSFRPMSLL